MTGGWEGGRVKKRTGGASREVRSASLQEPLLREITTVGPGTAANVRRVRQSQTSDPPTSTRSDHIIHFSALHIPLRVPTRPSPVLAASPQTPFSLQLLVISQPHLYTPLGYPIMSRASTARPQPSSSRTPVDNGATAADNVVRTKILLLGMRRCVHPYSRSP